MKDGNNSIKIEDADALNALRMFDDFFQLQLSTLKELAKRSIKENNKKRINQIYPLVDSLLTSGNSIIFLVRHGLMTEGYIIARAFLERLVNACYLLTCEQKEFDDYVDFSMQKVYRSIQTKKDAYEKIGQIIPVPDFSKIPIVAKGLKKYTSQRGKEITRWTTLRIDKRIEAVGEKVKDFNVQIFLATSTYLYEDASEAAHGTLYGSLFHTGIFYGVPDPKKGEAYLNGLRIVMYMLLGLIVEGLLYSAQTEIDVKDLIKVSTENFEKLRPYFEKRVKIESA